MNCKGLFGALLGHKYEPRYSQVFPANGSLKTGEFSGPAHFYVDMVNAWKNKVYCGDVCTRCGNVINQERK